MGRLRGSNRAAAALAGVVLALAVGVAAAPAPARSAPLIAAAGDIACGPSDPDFLGGGGSATKCRQRATSRLLRRRGLDAVLPLGDLMYSPRLRFFRRIYGRTWGRLKRRSHPVIGNHDYFEGTSSAKGYFDYWNGVGDRRGRAGWRGAGWYSYRLGRWHVVALNSNCDKVGCGARSPQLRWLRRDLRRSRARCTLAYFHHPLFSSGPHERDQRVSAFWRVLYRQRVDVILNGHDHLYERFAPQTPAARLDRRRGIAQFTVGTGGHSLYPFRAQPRRNSVERVENRFGVLEMRLRRASYTFRFRAIGGGVLDRGARGCSR
jgi:acid phosphatase type 7